MTSKELEKLNAYPEFHNQQQYNNVLHYLHTHQLPVHLNTRQQHRFQEKFAQDFTAIGNEIWYHTQRLNIPVCSPAQHQAKMKAVYHNIRQGFGDGINQFYAQVAQRWLGIRRFETTNYLKHQADYQISRPIERKHNTSILSKTANERWEMDCIDMTAYKTRTGMRYILTIVDVFSNKVWLRPLKTQNGMECGNALEDIMREAHTTPHIIQTDNGSSFQGQFSEFLQERHIKQIFIPPHQPQSNGKVERMNGEVRKKIRFGFVRNGNNIWVDDLNAYADNLNSQKTSSTGYSPNEIWTQGYHAPNTNNHLHIQPVTDDTPIEEIHKNIQKKSILTADRQRQNRVEQQFTVGQRVRVKMEALSNKMRARNKNGMERKKTAITYSPIIYQIHTIFPPTYPIPNNPIYNIKNKQYSLYCLEDGELYRDERNAVMKFYGSDLQPIGQNIRRYKPPTNITENIEGYEKAERINKI